MHSVSTAIEKGQAAERSGLKLGKQPRKEKDYNSRYQLRLRQENHANLKIT
jgi:hypothetical protein